MKKLSTLLVTVLITINVFAQAPQKMSYQAVVRNSADLLVKSSPVGMQISILQGSESGTPVYVETQIATTNINGLVTIEIGGGTPVTGTFADIDWSTGVYFLTTETDPTGGTSYSITGIIQLLSVPYALFSKSAETAADKIYVDALEQRLQDLEDIVFAQLLLPTNGLVAYFPFSGNAVDESGNNLNGTISEAMPATDRFGHENGAYYFNGTSSFIKVSDNILLNVQSGNSLTISCWVKHDLSSTNVNTYIISKYAGYTSIGPSYAVGTGTEGDSYSWQQIAAENDNGKEVRGSLNIHDGNWHNLISVINMGETVTLYVDGVLDKSVEFPLNGSIINDLDLYFGCGANQAQFYKGSIDDIRIYNRSLNQAEIKQLYNEDDYPSTLVEDIEGNSYNTLKLGDQSWMVENLKATKYNDGTAIPNVTDGTEWDALTTPAYCWYNNDESAYKNIYGALYNWNTLDPAINGGKNVCPSGWHVATDAEWITLINYLTDSGFGYEGSGSDIAKSIASATNWTTDPIPGNVGNDQTSNNTSGFNAVPGGARAGIFQGIGEWTTWWTSTPYNENANVRYIRYDSNSVIGTVHARRTGNFTRCLKD